MKIVETDTSVRFFCEKLNQWKYIKLNDNWYSPCSNCIRKRCANMEIVVAIYKYKIDHGAYHEQV